MSVGVLTPFPGSGYLNCHYLSKVYPYFRIILMLHGVHVKLKLSVKSGQK